jgi:hypothetical protein
MTTNRFRNFPLFLLGLVVCGSSHGRAATTTAQSIDASAPAICFWSPDAAMLLRQRALAHDPAVAEAVETLVKRANSAMKLGPFSVVDKQLLPPSGDKHDYSTLGRYYWPNPKTPNGMPWIRQDGKTNPDYFNGKIGDSERFVHLVDSVVVLSRAYYLTGQEKFAERAALLLRTWFIDPATKMNPNAKYGGRFPGTWDGVCYGIHGTRELMDIADAIGLLRDSAAWKPADQSAMTDWFGQYLTWLTTSDLGKEEGSQKNNHGIAWDCLVIRLAIFTGQRDLARRILDEAPAKRIATQIQPDGKMPLELARAEPWDYTRYALEFLFKLSVLGDRENVDLWHYRSSDGRSIRVAFDYLIDSICKKDGSIDQAILAKAVPDRVGPLLQVAARVYHDPRYLDIMKRIGAKPDLVLQETSVNGILSQDPTTKP